MPNYITYTLNQILADLQKRRRQRPQEKLMDAAEAVVKKLKADDLEFAIVEIHYGSENFRAAHTSDSDLTDRDVLLETIRAANETKKLPYGNWRPGLI